MATYQNHLGELLLKYTCLSPVPHLLNYSQLRSLRIQITGQKKNKLGNNMQVRVEEALHEEDQRGNVHGGPAVGMKS